jgi:hypothetical protein
MEQLLTDVRTELERAEQWGTDFDDANTINDWISYITGYTGHVYDYARSSRGRVQDLDGVRSELLKVAGLALSAVKAMDRNGSFPPRHYD